jgi:uncharacterized protein (TIGR00290 family)
MQNAFFNWSGGKDSALALFYALQQKEYTIKYLFTSVNSNYNRISMHGVREELLDKQAEAIGIALQKVYMPEFCDMEVYDKLLSEKLKFFKEEGIEHTFFGDIFLEDLRAYREKQLEKVGIEASFPLWKRDTRELINEFIDLGFKTVVSCVSDKYLDESFVGRVIDKEFIEDLPADVDPCGENGEFHTFVFDGPIFKNPIDFTIGEKTYRKYENKDDPHLENGFWFCDLIPQ